jgi:protein TonB
MKMKSIHFLIFLLILTMGFISCATTNETLVQSNQGKITISDLIVEQDELNAGSFIQEKGQLFIEYPDGCYGLRIDGTVQVFIDIETTGKVSDSKVMRGIGGGCDESVLRTIRNTEFNPATDSNGNPVAAQHFLKINFRL